MMFRRVLAFLPVLGIFLSDSVLRAAEVRIITSLTDPRVTFAIAEISGALRDRGDLVTQSAPDAARPDDAPAIRIVQRGDEAATPESFTIAVRPHGTGAEIELSAPDAAGLLYGGLELAEQIRIGGWSAVQPISRAPHFAMRGVKFNLPLDVRTPSYSDMSDAGQANIATVWDFTFWREFLDTLARHRYNYVSLWNLHPFPSLVKVPEYPAVALADVQRSTMKFAEDYSTRTEDIVSAEMLEQTETLQRMSIDEKIAFWRRVMEYGRDRNIDFYIITWNLYTYGADGKHGITAAIDNPVTQDYFRRSVAALFRTYPLLRGIGVTAGENLGRHDSSFEEKENWLFATYGQGVLDVAREQPGRKIRFIHRQHETRAADITRTFAPLVDHPDIDFVFSFKYAQAHVMSSTKQPFHHDFVASLGDVKTLWTLRNDDALLFRWGAPDFVREFIHNMPREVSQGVYYGSDMWVWGREFISLEPSQPRELEIEKHWFNWVLWGRLAYDPTLDNERIRALLALRFPGVDARTLFDAWQNASLIYPLTTGFHWGRFDFQWYIEACRSRPGPAQTLSGFHDVNRFITLPPHPGTDNISIPDYADAVLAGRELHGTTPLQVAAALHEHAAAALQGLEQLDPTENDGLRRTLNDIRAMALLGHYYGHKIAGATELHLFRRTGHEEHRRRAVAELTQAVERWHAYTAHVRTLYQHPLWTNRVGTVDWNELDAEVVRDVALAREAAARP